jgi:hypothetical protein
MNWWICVLFACGSALFAVGSLLSLSPGMAQALAFGSTRINRLFFGGSLPFTTAAYLQLHQATKPRCWLGWRPRDVGWLSCALQFPGTLLFNVNTFDAMGLEYSWIGQDLAIWTPDLLGSILFLLSGYLAFLETCRAPWAWQPDSLPWWVTFTNLVGCSGFMIAALTSFVAPHSDGPVFASVSLSFTLIGALGFLIGSLLMLAE